MLTRIKSNTQSHRSENLIIHRQLITFTRILTVYIVGLRPVV